MVIGFGTAGRIALTAVRNARAEGIKVGLFRPISVSPFPYQQLAELVKTTQGILVTEMNAGQMLEDVQKAVKGRAPIEFYARLGGIVPYPDEILGEIRRLVNEPKSADGDPRKRWMQRLKDGVITLS